MVGPLLVPAVALTALDVPAVDDLAVGVVGDAAVERGSPAVQLPRPALAVRQVEVAGRQARRGPAARPGRRCAGLPARRSTSLEVYAEVPLTWGLLRRWTRWPARADGAAGSRAKFRTGGLAAELFPTPVELAAVICACRDRDLPFKLTAGLHHALRHTDPETGFTHHGFLNVLAAAARGGRRRRGGRGRRRCSPTDATRCRWSSRPGARWTGRGRCGSASARCSVDEPLDRPDRLGLLPGRCDA